MIEPLSKGYMLNHQYKIKDVIGVGGNSYVYVVENASIGLLLVKEYIYGLATEEYDLFRDESGHIHSTSTQWVELNEKLALKEQKQLRRLRDAGFVFYEAALQSFPSNNTYYTPILNSKGTVLKDCVISNVQNLYHYTLIVLKAIANLHKIGFIHLDISPDNLLITPYDVGFLIDFGSTKSLSDLDNDIMCKTEYAASEVLERVYYCDNVYFKHGDLGVWSDIYSIGKVMLYLENQCIHKDDYKEELRVYHEVALKATKRKSSSRFQTIEQMQTILNTHFDQMNYGKWKMRAAIIHKAKVLNDEIDNNISLDDSFYYKNRNHLFVGREEELTRIYHFEKSDKAFSYLTISAPAASGKSALIYQYISKHRHTSDYRYVYMDGKELDSYHPNDLVYLGFNVMMVVDYVSGYYKEIASFIEKAMTCQGAYQLRVIFIERDQADNHYPSWMEHLKTYTYHFNELIHENIYAGNIYLKPLHQSEMMQLISNEVYEKLVKIDIYQRPLYALMLSKMMDDQEVRLEDITYIDVLEYIVSKEQKRMNDLCDRAHVDFDLWNQYYVLATLCSSLNFEEIEVDISDVQLRQLLSKMNLSDCGFVLNGLQPDLIGEYYILSYFKNIRKKSIRQMMTQAWDIDSNALVRTLIHMEEDFHHLFRNEFLNVEMLYYPHVINDDYHVLLKHLTLRSDLMDTCTPLLEKYYEFYIKDNVLLEYNGNNTVLCIPSHVECVGRLQGLHIDKIEEVIVSNQTRVIGKQAFYYHSNLRKVVLGDNVTTIEEEAFTNCVHLKEVKTNHQLQIIGKRAFENTALESMDFPNSLVEIRFAAFRQCHFKHITLPSSIKCIGSYAFSYNHALIEHIHYACTLDKSGKGIFKGSCINHVNIYSHHISEGLFSDVELKTVILNEGLKEIGPYAFSKNLLKEVIFPSSLEKIAIYAFEDNTDLVTIKFNDGLKIINPYAFRNTAMTMIELPETLIELGAGCFSEISTLVSCVLKGQMTTIENDVFCRSSLQTIFINAPIETIGIRAFASTNLSKLIFPSTLKTIEAYAFSKCNQLSDITLNDGLTHIEQHAFEETNLTHLHLPSSVRIIRDSAFYGCLQLSRIILNEGITYLGFAAFGNTALKQVVLPSTVNQRAFFAFKNTTKLLYRSKELQIAAKLEKDRYYKGLENLFKSYTSKGRNLYDDHSYRLDVGGPNKEIIVPEGIETLTTVRTDYFQSKDIFEPSKITLPSTLKYIEDFAFSNTKIEEIILPPLITAVPVCAFNHCLNLKKVVLNKGLMRIKSMAFGECESLEEITFPMSVRFIHDYVFSNTAIKQFNLPKRLYALGSVGHMQIESLEIPKETRLVSYYEGNHYIRIHDNPCLKWIKLHESNFKYKPTFEDDKKPTFPEIFDNPQLESVEVVFNDELADAERLNLFCKMQDYPFHFTNTSVILHAKGQDVTKLYHDFIDNHYVFEQYKQWMN